MKEIDTLRKEVAALIGQGRKVNDKIQALRKERATIQSAISERTTKLGVLAKLGNLTDADKASLQQILGPASIPSGEKIHAPNA